MGDQSVVAFLMGCPAQLPEEASGGDDGTDSGVYPEEASLGGDGTDSEVYLEEASGGDDDTDSKVYMETFANAGLRKAANMEPDSFSALRVLHQDFALADYRRLAREKANIVTSTVDKQLLLSMVALGAAGTTLDAVNDASGLATDGELPHLLVNDWDQHLAGLEGITTFRNLWGQERYLFADGYLENQAGFYGPLMKALDFQTATIDSATQINDALPALLLTDFINSRTRLVVAQGLGVSRAWPGDLGKENFSGRFGVGEEQRWVDMVHLQGLLNVAETEQYRAVEVPFVGQELY